MTLSDRCWTLLIGVLIGFVLGYIVRFFQDLKTKKKAGRMVVERGKDEKGFMRNPVIADVLMGIIVVVVAWSSFATAHVNGKLQNTIDCLTQYNVHQGQALSSRDTSIKAGTRSEIHLWTRYGHLYEMAKSDPTKIPEAQQMLNRAIAAHKDALQRLQDKRDDNPYPNPDILQNCKERND